MNFLNAFAVGLKEIWANKFRAVLTMAGIILGVASLVAMTALVKGIENGLREAMIAVGGLERITIYPAPVPAEQRHRMDEAVGFTMNDVQALRRSVPLVTELTPEIRLTGTLARGRKHFRPYYLIGCWPGWTQVYQYEVEHGRLFNDVDDDEARSVCVIGTTVRDELFGSPKELGREVIPLGEKITINGQLVTIIGMFKHFESETDRKKRELEQAHPPAAAPKKGTVKRRASNRSSTTVFDVKNGAVILPINTAWMKFHVSPVSPLVPDPQLTGLSLKIGDPEAIGTAVQQVRNVLMTTHHGIEDFGLFTAEKWSEGIDDAVVGARISGGIIAGISLLVGGIGIMNIMLASITERVREIGIRKAVGASFRDVFLQILVESVVIAVIGGLLGLAASTGLVKVIGSFSPTDNSPQITPIAMLVAFSFSVGVGVLSGLYPAFKAARMNPIQALRYE
ncbi:MAG: ABC transporter permease [Verrucomicrobia bacterium]|nr:ABC transporter permease [Verrucomicrobiota bacterium]